MIESGSILDVIKLDDMYRQAVSSSLYETRDPIQVMTYESFMDIRIRQNDGSDGSIMQDSN